MQPGSRGFIQRLDPWGYVALIFILALFCYWPALNGELLWDDPAHVTRPDQQSWGGLIRIWTHPFATQQYYPVLHSVFWFEHRLWGDSTLGYHLANVLQHAASACLLAFFLRRLRTTPTESRDARPPGDARASLPAGAEWVAALLFVSHPKCVESVAWISEQKNTLSLLLLLAAAFTWLAYIETRRLSSWVLATFFFMMALGSKTATVVLPPSLLVVLWWRNGSLSWRKDILPLAPWFLLSVTAGLTTAWVEKNMIGADGEEFALTLVERTLLAGRIVWFYLSSQFWPVNHAFFYSLWDVPAEAPGWTGYLAACIVLTVALWLIRKRTRGPLATWLLFVGSLFPVLGFFNIFPFIFSYVADHFQYIATACFVTGTAIGTTILLNGRPRVVNRFGWSIVGCLILVFAGLSHDLSRRYQNNETLCRASIAEVPDNWMSHRVLAWALSKDPDRGSEAIQEYEISLQLNPDSPDSLHGLALLLARSPDRRAEAIGLYRRAIELRPHFAESHYALAFELEKDPDRLNETIAHLEVALAAKPKLAPAHLLLAKALSQIPDRQSEAFFHFEEAVRLDPDSAEAQFAMANALVLAPGRLDDAIAHYEAALRLDPEAAVVHYNLGTALALTRGRMSEAITQFESAIRIRPDYAEAHANLADALATQPGRLPEALTHYEEALRIKPDLARVHFSLAMRLATLPGRQDDAIRHAEAGLALDPVNLEARNGLAILYVQVGRLRDARAQWEKAVELDPDYEAARENLRRLDQMTRPQ
ncbi:MAG: tetratricopeptide repeat protein [Opitutaceae bacterium]